MAEQIVVPSWWHSPELDKLDRRTRKTRESLYVAMAELMSEKGVSEISVTELTKRADVNRSTFYIHFEDIYDLLDCMRRDFTSAVRSLVQEHATELSKGEVEPMLASLYSYFSNNREAFNLVFGARNADSFYGDVAIVIREALMGVLSIDDRIPEQMQPYIIDFIARGSIGMARSWVEEGCREPVDEMLALNTALIETIRKSTAK